MPSQTHQLLRLDAIELYGFGDVPGDGDAELRVDAGDAELAADRLDDTAQLITGRRVRRTAREDQVDGIE